MGLAWHWHRQGRNLVRRASDLGGPEKTLKPKLGRTRRGQPPKLFVAKVLAAKELSGFSGGGAGKGRAARPGMGRGGVAAWRAGRGLMAQRGRRVVVKARIVRHGPRMAPLGAHLSYLRREGVTKDGEPAKMFDGESDNADVGAFAKRAANDRHHFRFIVSPEDAADLSDLHAYTRDLVQEMERDLGTELDWLAVDHWNTDNPHVHLIVRGKEADGRDLVIHREYISRGLRARAQELATIELGPRTEHEIRSKLAGEVTDERWTQLDRALQRAASLSEGGLIDVRPEQGGPAEDRDIRSLMIGRLQRLEAMGLARPAGTAQWKLEADAEATLREIGKRGDIIRTMNRSLGRAPTDLAIYESTGMEQPLVGRVAGKGLDDELAGKPYIILDGIDGRSHYVRLGPAIDISDIPTNAVVRAAADSGGRWTTVRVLSDQPIGEQVSAQGSTWLDRQLVAREKPNLAPTGFGAEVAEAMSERIDHLVGAGLARRGRQIQFASDLLGTLERRELEDIAGRIAADTNMERAMPADGDRIEGFYRRRFDLASGRFALIDDGRQFVLVPWRPELDRSLGQEIVGNIAGRGVQWLPGRERGPSIG